jgi:threonine aldolase
MRQAGILAAAGLHALEHHVARLAEDHANAQRLAAGLASLGVAVEQVQTNMVFARFPPGVCAPLQERLARQAILAFIDPRSRFVTHFDVDAAAIDRTVSAFAEFFRESRAQAAE